MSAALFSEAEDPSSAGRYRALGDFLRTRGASDVFLVGLATGYCLKATALDARQLGFRTDLIDDACRGVDLQPGDIAKAIDTMRAVGVKTPYLHVSSLSPREPSGHAQAQRHPPV